VDEKSEKAVAKPVSHGSLGSWKVKTIGSSPLECPWCQDFVNSGFLCEDEIYVAVIHLYLYKLACTEYGNTQRHA
jgi:hypothetical protein